MNSYPGLEKHHFDLTFLDRFKNEECSIQVTIAEHLLIINDLIQFLN